MQENKYIELLEVAEKIMKLVESADKNNMSISPMAFVFKDLKRCLENNF